MANVTYPRNGFTMVTRNGSEGYSRQFPAQASTNQPIALGDAVSIVNGIVVPCTAGQDPNQDGFGVVTGVYTSAGRPFTHSAVKLIASATPGRVDVLYDPFAEFVVRCETSVGPSNINKNVILSGLSANPNTGRTSATVTIPASASVNDLFRIVRYATYNDIVGINGLNVDNAGGAGQPVVVRWNRHTYTTRNAGQ